MVLILSFLLLGEIISGKQLLGFGLLLISSVTVSIKKTQLGFKLTKAFILILLTDLLWALPYVIVKFVSESLNFQTLITYESFGIALGGIILYLVSNKTRLGLEKTLKKIKKTSLCLIFFNECIYLIAKLSAYLAVSIGPVILVAILGSTQIFLGLILAVILATLAPKIFKEDLSQQGLVKKSILAVLAFIGVYLVG